MGSAEDRASGPTSDSELSRSESGATAVEYALMAAMITLVIIGAVTVFGQNIIPLFVIPASAF